MVANKSAVEIKHQKMEAKIADQMLGIEYMISRTAFGFAEAARSLGCHLDTLRRAANERRLRTIRLSRRRLIPASEMQRILTEGI